eukprot:jgi/Botrbrau1/21906/Bobra.0249s0034.1
MRGWCMRGLLALAVIAKVGICKPLETPLPTAPAFVWSPYPYLLGNSASDAPHVSYEVVPASVIGDTLAGTAPASQLFNLSLLRDVPPDVIVAFLGGSVRAHEVGGAGGLLPFKSLLQQSASWLALPYVSSKGGQTVKADILAELERAGREVHTISSSDAAHKLLPPSSSPSRVVAILLEGSSPEEQMEEVLKVHKQIANTSERPLFLFASDHAQEGPGAAHRRLQQAGSFTAAPQVTQAPLCGPKCDTQVKLLEAFILAVTLLVALASGTAMLGALQAPTMFETAKDASINS